MTEQFRQLRGFFDSEFHAAGRFHRHKQSVQFQHTAGIPRRTFAADGGSLRGLIPPDLESVDRHAVGNDQAGNDFFEARFGELGKRIMIENIFEFRCGGKTVSVGNEDIEHFRIRVKKDRGLKGGTDRQGKQIARCQRVDAERRGPFVDGSNFSPDFGIRQINQTAGFDLLQFFESGSGFGSRHFRIPRSDRFQYGLTGNIRRKQEFHGVVQSIAENLSFQHIFFGELDTESCHDFAFGDGFIPSIKH